MHPYLLPYLAAISCAICNSVAVILQKISEDKEKNVKSLDARLILRLSRSKLYVFAILLDGVGWLFTVYAVQYLPLFLVEAVIAANIVVTALLERIFLHQVISRRTFAIILVILAGLAGISLASSPERSRMISEGLRWLIILAPIPLTVIAVFLARRKNRITTFGLAMLSGIAFGGTSVMGRIFRFSKPIWHTIYSPIIFGLIASGILGILLFSIALQRSKASLVNAVTTASQALIPSFIGVVFLGDSAKHGLLYLVYIGFSITLAGVLLLTCLNETP